MTKLKSEKIYYEQIEKLQIRLKEKKTNFSLKKNQNSNTLRNGDYKQEAVSLDLSDFTEVLRYDLQEKWIQVESRISFSALCRFTLSLGFVPPVVPEFKLITIGGAIMGGSIESSSHVYGQVSDTCLEYECLLGNGELVTASPHENADLFYGLSGSYGTLAILTAVKLRLIPAKKWVSLSYKIFTSVNEGAQYLTTQQPSDYIEGIVLNPFQTVVIEGQMTDQKHGKPYRQKHYWSPWYIQHISKVREEKEYMDLYEYLFRFDRGAFWVGRYAHSLTTLLGLLFHIGIPKISKKNYAPSTLFRFLFGWSFTSERLYRFWHRMPTAISQKLFFIHDFYAPAEHAATILSDFMKETGIFPIWLCPIKGTTTPQFLSPHYGDKNFLNIGLYGIPNKHELIPQLTVHLENKILTYGGRKMLYSLTYYNEKKFAEAYSLNHYDALRKKFAADAAFPSLYNKVTNK